MSYKFKKPRRSVKRVFIHCSASDNTKHDNVATMDRWHRDRGWSGVGYHYFIRKNGHLEIGRNIEKIPAAQGGKSKKPGSVAGGNRNTIAICLHGLAEDKFTEAQFKTLRELCWQIYDAYDCRVTFHGHREVAFKACPVFDYKSVLKLDDKGRLGAAGSAVGFLHQTEDDVQDRNFNATQDPNDIKLRYGMKNPMVGQLQQILNEKGYSCGAVDGHFGGETRGAVLRMKADNEMMTVDEAISINDAEACEGRDVGIDRAEASSSHVIQHSKTAQMASDAMKANVIKIGAGAATGVTALNIDSPQAALDKAQDALGQAEQGKQVLTRSQDIIEQLTGGAIDLKTVLIVLGVGVAVAAIYGWWKSRGALMSRVEDYRSGRNLGH